MMMNYKQLVASPLQNRSIHIGSFTCQGSNHLPHDSRYYVLYYAKEGVYLMKGRNDIWIKGGRAGGGAFVHNQKFSFVDLCHIYWYTRILAHRFLPVRPNLGLENVNLSYHIEFHKILLIIMSMKEFCIGSLKLDKCPWE